jgi:hypothetical protein
MVSRSASSRSRSSASAMSGRVQGLVGVRPGLPRVPRNRLRKVRQPPGLVEQLRCQQPLISDTSPDPV